MARAGGWGTTIQAEYRDLLDQARRDLPGLPSRAQCIEDALDAWLKKHGVKPPERG